MPETSTPTLTPDATTKVPAFQNNNPGNVELGALKSFILNQAGLANGLATLDADGKLDAAQIPANLDDVLVYGSYALLPAVGESGKLYITTDVNGSYYWNGTSYQMLNNSFVRYRGTVSSLPSNPQAGDWFIAASTFTEGGVTYTSGAIYLYNGSSWDDATAVFGQFVRKSDISQTIGPEIDKVPSNAAVNGAINAISGGITPKGDILSANLPPASPSNKGWQYYCTDLAKYAVSDGTQWVYFSNTMLTNTMDATDTSHALTNAVVTQCCNEVKGELSQHDARLQNLEQKAGDYSIVQYRGTNAVPTGKAKYGLVKSIVGKSRAWNQLVQNGNFASGDGWVLESGVTASFSGNVATISSTTSSNGIRREIDFINGHKYLVSAEINTESALAVKFGSSSSGGAQVQITTSVFNQFVKYSEIKTASADSYQFYIFVSGTYSNLKVRNVTLYDLTLIFGSGNEPSTVADALAQLPALGQYNAYDAGSLHSTVVSGVESDPAGKNFIDISTYGNIPNLNRYGVCRTLFAGTYTISGKTIGGVTYASGFVNMAGDVEDVVNVSGTFSRTFTITETKTFALWHSGYSTSQFEDLMLNIGSSALPYEPYRKSTLSLSETVTLRSAGSVAEVLDVETGEVTHPIGEVIITESNTSLINDNGTRAVFTVSLSSVRKYDSVSDIPNVAMAGFIPVPQNTTWTVGQISMSVNNTNNVFVIEQTGMTLTQFLQKYGNQSILYELATPDTPTNIGATPNNTILTEGDGTIDTIQTQTPVIDNCLDVGYLAV